MPGLPNAKDIMRGVVQIHMQLSSFNWTMPFRPSDPSTSSCSGWFFEAPGEPNPLVATCSHCLVDARKSWVSFPTMGRKMFESETVSIYPACDLAILRITDANFPWTQVVPFKIGDSDSVVPN